MKKFWMPEKWRFFIFLIFLTVSHFFIITETSNVRVIVENLREYPRKYRNLFSLEQDDDQIALQMVWILDHLTKIKQIFFFKIEEKETCMPKRHVFFHKKHKSASSTLAAIFKDYSRKHRLIMAKTPVPGMILNKI